ncbi:MAG: hypothetical protein LPK45_01910 [Bacteroidota bacterium]|nr:hypothetical protein [Bacteroidota bacterium]MDX5429788.1 hypothetical protein [Bacteroidota bacterium]MDX5468567.1 hypothetical protein [Bacteroidota bacterium]
MKRFIFFLLALLGSWYAGVACPVCEKQQPKLLKGISHGAGPESNWDMLIVVIMVLLTVTTLYFSFRLLLRPKEGNPDHIKMSILKSEYHEG